MEAADGEVDTETHPFKLNQEEFPNEFDLLVIGTGIYFFIFNMNIKNLQVNAMIPKVLKSL